MADVLRVAQLSDAHFLERGLEPEGSHGYDTSDAFEAVLDDLSGRELDLVVVTGDIADHGRAERVRDRCCGLRPVAVSGVRMSGKPRLRLVVPCRVPGA